MSEKQQEKDPQPVERSESSYSSSSESSSPVQSEQSKPVEPPTTRVPDESVYVSFHMDAADEDFGEKD